MDVHQNARLTLHGRERIVRRIESGQTRASAHRSTRPHRLRKPTPQAVVEQVETLRRARRTGNPEWPIREADINSPVRSPTSAQLEITIFVNCSSYT